MEGRIASGRDWRGREGDAFTRSKGLPNFKSGRERVLCPPLRYQEGKGGGPLQIKIRAALNTNSPFGLIGILKISPQVH